MTDPITESNNKPTVNMSGYTNEDEIGKHERIVALKAELEETKVTLGKNARALRDNGENLEELGRGMNDLADSTERLRLGAKRVRSQMWYKDMKTRVCLCSGVIIILLVIVVTSIVFTHR